MNHWMTRSRLDGEDGDGHWVMARPWLTADRIQFGCYVQLMRELIRMADSSFFNYMRIEPTIFVEIFNRVGLESKNYIPLYGDPATIRNFGQHSTNRRRNGNGAVEA